MTRFILRFRILIIIALLLLTVPFAYQLKDLTRDAGVSSLVPETHPAFEFSSTVEELFGAEDQIVVGVNAKESIYTEDALRLIFELTRFFEEMEALDEDDVLSLTNVDDIRGREGQLIIEPLVEEDELDDLTPETIQRIRKRVRDNPLFRGKLVSEDEKSAVVLAGVPTELGLEEESIAKLKADSLAKLEELRARYPEITLDFSGPAMLKAYISEYMQNDLKRLFPLAIVAVACLILILLRSFFGMLVPVLVTVFAVVWTFGLKAWLGSPITIVETAIPVVLIAIGCADGIHLISEFLTIKRNGHKVREAVFETMHLLRLPVILTSLTTGLGFVSLITAPGVSIRNMGIYLGFGVMVAMLFSLLFIPALLSFFRDKSDRDTDAASIPDTASPDHPLPAFEKWVAATATRFNRKKKTIALMALLLLAASIFGILNIQVESDEIRYLKPSNEFRQATENIQDSLGGITSLDIVIEAPEADSMKDPGMLKAIEDLQRFCEKDDLVSYTLSIVDLLKRINQALHDGDPQFNRLPNETEQVERWVTETVDGQPQRVRKVETIPGKVQVAQYLLLYEMSGGESLEENVDPNYQIAKISVRLKDMSSQRLQALLEKLEPFVEERFPDSVSVRYANHYIRVVMMDLIIDSQIYSLITVLITITILMSIMFRKLLIGIFTALPVFIAVLFNFSIMWAFDITLNIGTSIIASVGMGVGIDYAIHYFSRFKLLLKRGEAYNNAIIRAVTLTSRAILSNAAAVGLGFMVLLFSEYLVIANIGWITAVSMFTTAFGSLVILPALLAIFKPSVPGAEEKTVRNVKDIVLET